MKNKITDSVIVVTGGAGFIGSYVVEELLFYKPKKIIIVDNYIRGSKRNMNKFIDNSMVEFIEGDIRDAVLMEKVVNGADFIFHMAALRINACASNPKDGFDVMVNATFTIMELVVKYKIKKIIYSSSASIYGLAQNFPTPESDNPYNNQTFYGAAKLFGEQMLRSYKFMYGLDYVALRYFNAYGPRMDTDGKYTEVMIKWLDCITSNKDPLIYGDGSTSMDFVYVKDIAKANIAALLSDATDESFNIGNCVETSLKELLDITLQVNKSNLSPKYMPENSINPVSKRIADISKAEKLLGYKPTYTLEKGIEELSSWYFETKNVK